MSFFLSCDSVQPDFVLLLVLVQGCTYRQGHVMRTCVAGTFLKNDTPGREHQTTKENKEEEGSVMKVEYLCR